MAFPHMKWQDVAAQRLIDDVATREQWDVLNTAGCNLPFMAGYAIEAALRAFGRGDERLLIGHRGTQCVAMFILQRVGIARWTTFQPSQIPLGAWVAAPGMRLTDLSRGLLDGPLGAALLLSITQVDSLVAAQEPGDRTSQAADYIETGWIKIEGSFEDYWTRRGKNLRGNLRKQRNRLAADGVNVEFVELTAADEMARSIERYGALESSGWKVKQGTAIHPDNDQGRFYRDLFEHAAQCGEALVCELRFDGRTVASNLCLKRGSCVVVLKTTYDESLDKALSPALLLHQDHLQRLFDGGTTRRLEYFGKFSDWHSRFTEDRRALYHLTCFRWSWIRAIRDLAWLARGTSGRVVVAPTAAQG